MQPIIINSFKILKNNLIFIQPLMLYILLLLTLSAFFVNANSIFLSKIIILTGMVLFSFAFLAGWFYINELAVENFNEDDLPEEIAQKSIKNFKLFFDGAGKNFFKTLFGGLLYFIITALSLYGVYYLCMKYFGYPHFFEKISNIYTISDKNEIINIINSVPDIDKIVFVKWFFTVMFSVMILNFIGVLYYAVLTFSKYNIFKSLFKTIKIFVLNIYDCIVMMLLLFLLYLLLNFISLFLGTGTIGFVILIILMTMYLNYYLLLIFCYYYEKTKTDSNNGAECIG